MDCQSASATVTLQRRNLEPVLLDIRRCLVDPPIVDRARALLPAVWEIDRFVRSIASDQDKARALIDTTRAVRESRGPGGAAAEAQLMRSLNSTAYWCVAGSADLPAPDLEKRFEVLHELARYALECLAFRRPRDSFGGRRWSIAFEVLTQAYPRVDLPETVRVAQAIVRSSGGNDLRGALEFLKVRFGHRKEQPDAEMVELLCRVAGRAPSRSIAFGALDFLVETGAISEHEALDRMDEWKARNGGRC